MKLSYLLALGAVAVTPLVALAPAEAAPPSHWTTLGTRTVNPGTTHSTFTVGSRNAFRQVQLCTRAAPIRMTSYTVRLDNGRQQNIRVNATIRANSCTRVTTLTGGPRRIDRVTASFQRVPQGTRPQIRIMAR
ncbi:hypothetical protein EDF56_104369 [Novosphingobium sp. PhB165]|uniref:hypothetical protein n=1 Tax=Novosphingobium sp. PhB165 TaxID=2485105 RepID=UPI00104FFEA9|nr:hypothetical protein [Novosphingobium sp. PhB165]TCM18835.1 hypothetical protein EDF56_104369 [Novosphingobium sp. PhB165]